MLEKLMLFTHNWFDLKRVCGEYKISGGKLELPFLLKDQYYRIRGSVFNDGLHQYGDITDQLKDETFTGEIWGLAPPNAFIMLAEEIGDWIEANRKALDSPYTSENVIGVYSYTLKSGNGSASGGSNNDGITWQSQFKKQLKPWMKVSELL